MRILQIHPLIKSEALAPAAGGMERAALQLTRLLAARGHEVQLLPIPEGVGSRELWEVAPDHPVEVAAAMHIPSWRETAWLPGALLRLRPLSKGIKNLFYDSFALTALRREVDLFHPEIIHNHLARRPFPRLAAALRLRGALILTHHHGEPGDELEIYDRIVFPSRSAQESISSEAGIPPARTRYIHYPVSPVFTRETVEPGCPREGVLYVGAVRRRKGIDLLLDAYRLNRALWNTPLYVCGIGEDTEMLQEAMQDGIPVHWLGQLSPNALAKRLSCAKLVAIPSRLEGFSIAVLEALTCGAPVVGWAPQIRELETALGFPVGAAFDGRVQTAEELSSLMLSVLRSDLVSSESRLRLAKAAREEFSEDRYVEAYLSLYREMIRPEGKDSQR
jgi:glycosyltransferase involved in cell wall biosynthesis